MTVLQPDRRRAYVFASRRRRRRVRVRSLRRRIRRRRGHICPIVAAHFGAYRNARGARRRVTERTRRTRVKNSMERACAA